MTSLTNLVTFMKYVRHKPVDAFQMTADNFDNDSTWPKWVRSAVYAIGGVRVNDLENNSIRVLTKYGTRFIRENEWLVRDELDDVVLMEPRDFSANYMNNAQNFKRAAEMLTDVDLAGLITSIDDGFKGYLIFRDGTALRGNGEVYDEDDNLVSVDDTERWGQ